ncbi:MAG TPA: prepilin peptidase [Gemmatimonadaceae bacterium]|jgi:leader peptidase (prepilin peptidase)/N-methyltransferase
MESLWAVYSFVIGACFGSFLNVCISRWPEGLSVIRPRSRCPNCERPITALENIPLLSWVVLRGKCRGCGNRISIQYPIVELVVGCIWLATYLHYGLSFTAVRVAVFATVLLGIAVTDAKHYLIPDGFTAFGLVWVVLTALISLFSPAESPFAGAYGALIGACAGAGAIAISGWLGELVLRKEAMGFGDVTLMAVIGAAVGPARAILTIFIGAFIATVVFLGVVYPVAWLRARRSGVAFEPPHVPFGVFLAPAAIIALLWGHSMVSLYTNSMGL